MDEKLQSDNPIEPRYESMLSEETPRNIEQLEHKDPNKGSFYKQGSLEDSLKKAENQDPNKGSFYKQNTKSGISSLQNKLKNSSKKKLVFAILGPLVGGVGIIALIYIVMMSVMGFGIKQAAAVSKGFTYARVAQNARRATSRLIMSGFMLEADPELGLKKLSPSSAMDKMRGFEKNKVLGALEADGAIEYDGSKITIKDVGEIDMGKPSFKERLKNPLASIDQDRQLRKMLSQSPALKEMNNFFVNKTADTIIERVGARRIRWTSKQIGKLRGKKTTKERLGVAQAESREHVRGSTETQRTGVPEVDEAVDAKNDKIDTPESMQEKNILDRVDIEEAGIDAVKKAVKKQAIVNAVGGVSSMVVYSLCTINGLSNMSKNAISQNNDGAIRQGLQLQSAGDQIQSGDTSGEAIETERILLDDFSNTAAYQKNSYNPAWNQLDYVSLDPKAYPQPSENGWMKFFNATSVAANTAWTPVKVATAGTVEFTDFCNGIQTPVGGIVFGVSTSILENFVSGGMSGMSAGTFFKTMGKGLVSKDMLRQIPSGVAENAAQFGIDHFFTEMADIAGGNIYSGLAEDQYYNKADVGNDLFAQDLSRKQSFGVPLSDSQVAILDEQQYRNHKEELHQMSVFARILSTTNPYSLISQSFASIPFNATTAMGLIRSSILNQISTIYNPLSVKNAGSSLVLSFINNSSQVYAANATPQETHYGIQQWGFTPNDINTIDNDPDNYSLIGISLWAEENKDTFEKIDKKYSGCFGEKIEMSDILNDNSLKKKCLSDLPAENASNPNVLKWRLYKADQITADTYLDLQNITSGSTGSTSSTAGSTIDMNNIKEDSSSIACAPGSDDVGVHDGYSNYIKIPIRLCAIPNLPSSGEESTPGNQYFITGTDGKAVVNSRVSGAILELSEAAKKDGVNLAISSAYRTMSHQECLAKGGCGASGPAAAPGKSNHQMGLAIDFTIGMGICPTKINGICAAPSSTTWNWLNNNASKYGYKQLSYEVWHWSPNGS